MVVLSRRTASALIEALVIASMAAVMFAVATVLSLDSAVVVIPAATAAGLVTTLGADRLLRRLVPLASAADMYTPIRKVATGWVAAVVAGDGLDGVVTVTDLGLVVEVAGVTGVLAS